MDERLDFLQLTPVNGTTLPIPCSFQNRVSGAEGEVELNYWPPKNGHREAPEYLLLFILGNPGLLGYYPPFLDHLQSKLPRTYAIIAVSHIGHSISASSPPVPLSLSQQVNSKVELVETIRGYLDVWADQTGKVKPKIALMGHSVGAYMSCEVMKRVNKPDQEWPVYAGYLLFPTLGWIADTWNGWTLWPIFHRPIRPLLPLISPLLRPFHSLMSLPSTSRSLVNSPSVIQHVLSLSRDEMVHIRDIDKSWFESQNADTLEKDKGLFGIWAAGNQDGWVGRDGPLVQGYLGGTLGGRVKVLDGVPHAFCLTQEHSELVAETVARWLNPTTSPEDVPSISPSRSGLPPTGSSIVPM